MENTVYKIEAQGDTMYFIAANEDAAYKRMVSTIGDIPRKMLKFTKLTLDDVPEGEEAL
jgi:hypothetical protein